MKEYLSKLNWCKYAKVFSLGWQEQMEYRINNLMESLIGIISFMVLYFLWSSVYRSNHGQPIAGLGFKEMLTYILLAKFWDWVIDPSSEVDNQVPEDIRNGGLNRFLIRPISDRLYRFSRYLAHKILYGLMRIGPVIILIIFLPRIFTIAPYVGWWYLPIACFLALVLQFSFSYTVTVLAFWWLEIWGMLFLKRLIVSFLAGAWLPLTVLPEKFANILMLLPFQSMIFFPVQIVLGKLSIGDIHQGLLIQSVWIMIFITLSSILWTYGMKKYSAAGA